MRVSLFLVLLLAFSATSFFPEALGAGAQKDEVLVVDAEGKPLPEAEVARFMVTLDMFCRAKYDGPEQVARTDANGKVVLPPLNPGRFHAFGITLARKAGFAMGSKGVSLFPLGLPDATQRIVLHPAREIRMKVAGKDGGAIEGAEVWITPPGLNVQGFEVQQLMQLLSLQSGARPWLCVTSEADGSVRVHAPGSLMAEIWVRAPGFIARKLTVKAEQSEAGVIELEPGCLVEGKITTPEGQPVSGVYIQVTPVQSAPSMPEECSLTDEAGKFRFYGIRAGEYRIFALGDSAKMKGYLPRSTIKIQPGEQKQTLEIQAKPGVRVVGRVTEADGQPVSGAIVYYIPDGTSVDMSATQVRGDGSYELFVPTGLLLLHVRYSELIGPPRQTLQRTLRVRENEPLNDVDFRLPKSEIIEVQVIGLEGKPPEDARLFASAGYNMLFVEQLGPGRFRVKTFEGGPFSFLAWSTNENAARTFLLEKPLGKEPLELRLQRGFTLRGRFVGPDGRGIPGVEVRSSIRLGQGFFAGTQTPGYGCAVSDAEGRFFLTALLPDIIHTIHATAKEYTFWQLSLHDKKIAADHDLGEIKLSPADRVVEGLVIDEAGNPVPNVRVTVHTSTVISDKDGRFKMEKLPRGTITIHAREAERGRDLFGGTQLDEGEDFVLLPLFSEKARQEQHTMIPPLHVGTWVRGQEPVGGFKGRTLLLYFVPRQPDKSHPELLKLLGKLAERYAHKGLLVLCLYRASTDPETVKKETAEAGAHLLVGIDKPATPGAKYGYTQAFLGPYNRYESLRLYDQAGRKVWASAAAVDWRWQEQNLSREVERICSALDLRVKVLDADGKPVEGVRLFPICEGAHRIIQTKPVTDKDGICLLRTVPGPPPIGVVALSPTLGAAAEGIAQRDNEEIILHLAPQPPVSGRVVDELGNPIEGAKIHVTLEVPLHGDPPGKRLPLSVHEEIQSDGAGEFRIAWALPKHRVRLDIQRDGFWREHANVDAAAENQPRSVGAITLWRADKTLTLRVVDLDGKPIPNLTAIPSIGGGAARSEGNGMLVFDNFPNKPVLIVLSGQGSHTQIFLPPGHLSLSLASQAQARDLEHQFATAPQRREPVFPWRVREWVAGRAISAADLVNRPAIVAVMPEGGLSELRVGLLELIFSACEQYSAQGLIGVCILSADTPVEHAKRLAAGRTSVSLGIDAPVSQDNDAPGYSAALWRVLGEGQIACYIQEPSLQYHRIWFQWPPIQSEREISRAVEQTLNQARATLAEIMARVPVRGRMVLEDLRRKGVIAWEKSDPFAKGTRWISLGDRLAVFEETSDNFTEHRRLLGIENLNPVGIAFTEEVIFVGTSAGLLAHVRAQKSWNRVAPGRRPDLLTAPVIKLEQEKDGSIIVVMREETGKESAWRFAEGRWTPK